MESLRFALGLQGSYLTLPATGITDLHLGFTITIHQNLSHIGVKCEALLGNDSSIAQNLSNKPPVSFQPPAHSQIQQL